MPRQFIYASCLWMSESQDQNENTDLAFNIIAIILFIGFGIWAILVPDAMEEATPSGRHSAIKEILVLLFGGLMAVLFLLF